MRIELKLLRVKYNLTQGEMSALLGVSRATYSLIESGRVRGSIEFWNSVQREFEIPDAEMYTLMKVCDNPNSME